MKIAFYGDSLTQGVPGTAYFDLLQARLPDHTLINYGKGGDTVRSLHSRIERRNLLQPVDIAFVWVGVNDVFVKVGPISPLIKRIMRQLWTSDKQEFEIRYRGLLDLICPYAKRVIAISPLLIGEEIHNQWNIELAELSSRIENTVSTCPQVEYLDLRQIFFNHLEDKSLSTFVVDKNLQVALDVLTLRSAESVDRKAAKRGLHFTLDGVHLNSAGAELVAEVFAELIEQS